MKKVFFTILTLSLLFYCVPVKAQTVNEQLIPVLQQLILLITEQIKSLQKQLDDLKNQQALQEQKISSLQQQEQGEVSTPIPDPTTYSISIEIISTLKKQDSTLIKNGLNFVTFEVNVKPIIKEYFPTQTVEIKGLGGALYRLTGPDGVLYYRDTIQLSCAAQKITVSVGDTSEEKVIPGSGCEPSVPLYSPPGGASS